MLGLADRGLVPGKDIAVVGFDNIAEAGLYRPTLSTIEIGARRIGEEAARLLLRRIAAPEASSESIVLPPRLVVRASCGGTTT
jgi:LacI family transcriptional regulator